jgi:hypothetical protein
MVTRESVEEQLKKIGVNYRGWGRTEMGELPNIILPDEEIYECVNGFYEGGFALIVATNFRVLLIDKKPMRYLTVEDLRFDMINEIDYSHRLFGAQISISTGSKNLRFVSYNQPRLRKLIGHVQGAMAENKKKQSDHEEDQKLHLEQINQQLQSYLLAQHQQQQKIQEQLEKNNQQPLDIEPVRPSPELSDYLYAQGLLAQAAQTRQQISAESVAPAVTAPAPVDPQPPALAAPADLYAEGVQEIFGNQQTQVAPTSAAHHVMEINPLRIAYSKLPLAMRNKKFGRPSFHAHSQQDEVLAAQPTE